MSLGIAPSKVVIEDLQINNYDFEKGENAYLKDEKKFIQMYSFSYRSAIIRLQMKGEMTTDGITKAEFNGKPSYSFGFQFDNSLDKEAVEMMIEEFTDKVNLDEDYSISPLFKDDKLYIKLKPAGKQFAVLSNMKLDPNKIPNSSLFRGQKVTVFCELGAYLNFKDKKAGITLNAKKLVFEKEKLLAEE